MALTYVGGTSASDTTGANCVLDLTALTGGSDSSPSENDIVIVFTGFTSVADKDVGMVTSGYTEIADLYSNGSRDANGSFNYKIMGSTPDTSATCIGSGSALYGNVAVAHVWRGADTTTPMDVSPVPGTSINSNDINPRSITPVTAGAIIIVGGVATIDATGGSPKTPPSGISNEVQLAVNTGRGAVAVIASVAWTSGAVDIAPWTGNSLTLYTWTACALALRPALGGGGSTGQIKAKISGTMTAKPMKAKISGTFTTKPLKYKAGGVFVETGY